MSDEAAIRKAFADQTDWCLKLGSPFTAALCRLFGQRLNRRTAVGRAVLDWRGDPGPLADNLPLRLVGSLHGLVLSGQAPALTAVYPPHPLGSDDELWRVIEPHLASHAEALTARLDNAPQTNEVGRAAPLMVGLMTVVHETDLPLALFELGASAGLNLNLDRFAYDLGGVQAGDPSSAVRLAPQWEGAAPTRADVRILSRRGVDQSPLFIDRASDRERLRSYVWADQTERLARVSAAIEIAQAYPPQLDQGDAADWTEQVLTGEPASDVVRVLFHTVAFQYFSAASQARVRAHAAKLGENATPRAPFAWLRYELEAEHKEGVALTLTLWPGGEQRLVGLGHAHGQAFRLL